MIKEYIKNMNYLYEHFHSLSKASPFHQKDIHKGVYVTSKIRKEVMTSEQQGRITLNGQIVEINFYNQGGGVWLATVNDYVIDEQVSERNK